MTNKIDIICLNFRFYLLILKKKIEDFLHHDYVRMVYIKIRLKSIFDIQSKSEKIGTKKGVFIKKDKVGTFRGHLGTFRGHLEDI